MHTEGLLPAEGVGVGAGKAETTELPGKRAAEPSSPTWAWAPAFKAQDVSSLDGVSSVHASALGPGGYILGNEAVVKRSIYL